MNDKQKKNKELIEKFPFLQPRNIWTDKIPDDYDYSWTRVDEVEDGWQPLFLQMCEEIRQPLIEANYLDKFRFTQIKEKYGSLRLYHFGAPQVVCDILHKYEVKSERICVTCGKPATKISRGWICPYCDECTKETYFKDFMSLEEWFGTDAENEKEVKNN